MPANSARPARLHVSLDAITNAWLELARTAASAECGAVVKADAYGLGVRQVAPALARVGARTFFVASVGEGVELRRVLGAGPRIAVLNGSLPGDLRRLRTHALLPVLNAPPQVQAWQAAGGGPHALHVDTGMNRLGLRPQEAGEHWGQDTVLVLSHLACADEPNSPMNGAQLAAMKAFLAHFPNTPWSLAASAGIGLGKAYHGDLVRPGLALYQDAVRLCAPLVQVRHIPVGESVGYGASWVAQRPTRAAIIAIGYADGMLRALGNRGYASLHGQAVPVIGRVSMDLTVLDITDLRGRVAAGDEVCVFEGASQLAQLAEQAGTIPYEILTSIGHQVRRVHG